MLSRTVYRTAHLEDVIDFVDHLGSVFTPRRLPTTAIVTRSLAKMYLQGEVGLEEEEEQDQKMGRVIEEGVDAIASLQKMLPRLAQTLESLQGSLPQDSLKALPRDPLPNC